MQAGMNKNKTSHIAFFAFPFGSHPAALLGYVQRLAASAPPDVIFSFFNTQASNAKIFSTSIHNLVKLYHVWNGRENQSSSNPLKIGFGTDTVEMFFEATPDNFKKSVEDAEAQTGVKVSYLVADAFLLFAGDMAKELGIPWVAFWVAGATSLTCHVHANLIRAHVFANGPPAAAGEGVITNSGYEDDDKTLEIIPGLSAFRVSDLPEGVVTDVELPFAQMVCATGQKMQEADAVLVNSFEEFDPIATDDLKRIFKNLLSIGPFTVSVPPLLESDDPFGCIAWLDNHTNGSVVYVGFGSTASMPPPDEITAITEALEDMGIPFIWSLQDKSLLPKRFVETICGAEGKGKLVGWAPQLNVLDHSSIGVYVTHCGYNSMMESILCGVPIIGRPLVWENKTNCRFVEEVWKIGVKVEGGKISKGGMIKALESIMFGETGKKMKDNVGIIRERLLQSTGPNGSSTQNFKTFTRLLFEV